MHQKWKEIMILVRKTTNGKSYEDQLLMKSPIESLKFDCGCMQLTILLYTNLLLYAIIK